mgnify:CR=1 FL=1
MFSNLKTAFQNFTSKDKNEDEYEGEDIQAVIILLLEACQIDGDTGKVELEYIKKLLVNKFNFTSDQAEKNLLEAEMHRAHYDANRFAAGSKEYRRMKRGPGWAGTSVSEKSQKDERIAAINSKHIKN